ncbi:MAG: PilZ domain-containing protein [Candidatus Eremiobacteraeota bacterium]|nr:PilZ domain-containing protein [Candidatus Eremiobacteraeota bacterium]
MIEFALGIANERKAFVRGTVLSRTANGPRFVYRMRLDRMSAKEIDELARRMASVQQRQAAARREDAVRSLPTTDRLTRSSVRVTTQFPMTYRTPRHDARPAKAGDVSMGGMLMICADGLNVGEPIELRFTLPSGVLSVYPEETVALDVRTGRVTPLSGSDQRRPFEEMTIGARIVAKREVPNGYAYGVTFSSIDGFQREELARYTNAVQRSRNRH